MFDNPAKVFDEAILRPETQDREAFADGIKNITEAQQRVAAQYFDDGSYELACPPLQALLDIMAQCRPLPRGRSQEVRRMFTAEYLLESEWYRGRLAIKQRRDVALWKRHLDYIDGFIAQHSRQRTFGAVDVQARRRLAETELARVRSPQYLQELFGTLGADPLEPRTVAEHRKRPAAVAAVG